MVRYATKKLTYQIMKLSQTNAPATIAHGDGSYNSLNHLKLSALSNTPILFEFPPGKARPLSELKYESKS